MNASIWDAAVARDLRERLRRKHEGDMFTLAPELYGVEPYDVRCRCRTDDATALELPT